MRKMLVFVVATVILMAGTSPLSSRLVAAGATRAHGTLPAHAKELLVDDDRAQCPQATFTSIQAAVDASGPNDTVKVCLGTYPEQVRIVGHIHDGLKLESMQPLQAVIKWPATETFPLALIDFNAVNGVTLAGFTITGPFMSAACSPDRHEGVLIENAFDERIIENHITLIRNSDPALFHCQEGDSVAIGRRTDPTRVFPPGSAYVEHNVIDEYQKNGIQAVNAGTFVDARQNVIRASEDPAARSSVPNGVVVFGNAAANIEHNDISGNKFTQARPGTGVILDDAPSGTSRVEYNRIFDNDNAIFADAESEVSFSHNKIYKNLRFAIVLCGLAQCGGPLTHSTVEDNQVEDNARGIALFGADSNLLKSNHVERNGIPGPDLTDGIRINSSSHGNLIVDNHLRDNITHDCHDDSIGAGTSGTANTWEGNKGQTENRPALCKKD